MYSFIRFLTNSLMVVVFPVALGLGVAEFGQTEGVRNVAALPLGLLVAAALSILNDAACRRYFESRTSGAIPPTVPDAIHHIVRQTALHLACLLAGGAVCLRSVERHAGGAAPGTFALTLMATAAVYWLGRGYVMPIRPHHRGRRLVTFEEAKRLADRQLPKGDPGVLWGGVRLPTSAATEHFVVFGASGSGKSITIGLHAQSTLPLILPGSDSRALCYNPKMDLLSLLAGMRLRCEVLDLNPFDARGVAWDIARDCDSPAAAREIAKVLIAAEEGPNKFFTDSARDIATGVIDGLTLVAPGAWSLRDLVLLLKSPELTRDFLELHPVTRGKATYFSEPRTSANIFSTVASKIAAFETIAALWSKNRRKVSLRDWLAGEMVLVLGNDESVRSAMDAINRAIVKRATELILALPESSTRRIWVYFDEAREAGELDGLSSLVLRGRSKGCSVIIGAQSIEGLRDVYGDHAANELVGQFAHKALLRLQSPETAEWASRLVGDFERFEREDPSEKSTSAHRGGGLVKREAILPAEFMAFPRTTRETGLTGVYLSPEIGVYRATLSGRYLAESLCPRETSVPDFVPRPVRDQYLGPLSDEDRLRLGLPAESQPALLAAGDSPPTYAEAAQAPGSPRGDKNDRSLASRIARLDGARESEPKFVRSKLRGARRGHRRPPNDDE